MDPKPTCGEEVAELVDHFMTASAAGDGERKKLHLRTSKEALVMMFDMMIDKAMAKAAQKASGGDMSQAVRLELRELKKAVFVNASDGNAAYTQDTQDYMDRADTGWDAILKLAAEQTPPGGIHSGGSAGDGGNGSNGSGNGFDQADADEDIFRSQAVDRTYADYKEAVRQSQAASQVATEAQAVRKRDDRLQDRERAQHAKRDDYVKRTGRRPTCPVMAGSKACSGDTCADLYPDEKFVHPTVCKDKTHVVRGQVGKCLLFHFWPAKAKSPKNSRGGTSGRYSGGYPRQTGQRQGNPPRPSHPVTQADSKAMKDLKAKLSKARTDLKAERLGKKPTYSQVAAPTMPALQQPQQQPQQVLLAPQPLLQHVQIPQPPASKSDKLAEALKMMAEQLAIISAMA
jgi:hypothetical protein